MKTPPYQNAELLKFLPSIDLGSSIAELDKLLALETVRIELSAFSNLLRDKVDLVPGTKGSGKSALYRIIVEFLPEYLLSQKKAVIAHGVTRQGDTVFHAFKDEFGQLEEEEFVDFWCIYIVSLVNEQFIKNPLYAPALKGSEKEIDNFQRACANARIPDIQSKKSLRDILQWTLTILSKFRPRLTYKPADQSGEYALDLFNSSGAKIAKSSDSTAYNLPRFVDDLRETLDSVLIASGLNVWIMIDRLDEIFPRRSDVERKALRGLLRTMRLFGTDRIRVKVFLRDDMLREVVGGEEGFTALTHLTARQADTLSWSEDQILDMVTKRFSINAPLMTYLQIDPEKLAASADYRAEVFYRIFPETVHRGERQSKTLRWICTHTADGNGVVTPRDVIDLVTIALQKQVNLLNMAPTGTSQSLIDPTAIVYGLEELSKRKRTNYLQAEFPHLWKHIEKFQGGRTEYTEQDLKRLLGSNCVSLVKDLVSIGFLQDGKKDAQIIYKIPFVYRKGLELTQGSV